MNVEAKNEGYIAGSYLLKESAEKDSTEHWKQQMASI